MGVFVLNRAPRSRHERRHEEGKLEFRDVEDDAAPVGWDEGGHAGVRKKKEIDGGKRIEKKSREE